MKKIFSLLLTAVMAIAISGCSKDDEPGDYEPSYDGVSVYLNAIEQFYDGEAQPSYTPTDRKGVYAGYATSSQESYDYIAMILENDKWGNKDVTVKLGEKGELGTLKVVGQTEALLNRGVYNEIIVDIKGYTPYTLEIITEKAADNGYYGGSVVVKKIGSTDSGNEE